MFRFASLIGIAAMLAGCATAQSDGTATTAAERAPPVVAAADTGPAVAHPDLWPSPKWPLTRDPATEAKIAALIGRMTLEEKVGQILQADLCCVTPADVKKYHLGSVLNGGNSGPYGDDKAPPQKWLQLADQFYEASVDTSDGGVGIPVIWGIDAVHGNSNIIGATLFPHNIGLGAAHDPDLIERIGRATAVEIRVTGQEWTFAPTVTVPQDYRWGRAYEGYSSDPKLVSEYVGRMIRGLQGPPSNGPLLKGTYVLASTKHFLADGGTYEGKDQGDARISEKELRDIHGAPYVPAIENGVATVMASFSSWNGVKMSGNKSLLTGVLKDRMHFDGFIVTDWNAQGQVKGCTNTDCPQAINAGIDMYMAPDSWKGLYASLLREVRDGTIPMSRLNDAVTRILREKFRLGVFQMGKPSSRPYSGQWDQLGSPAHRAIAREAVRKSLVLLRNSGSVLPIKPGARVLVAGDAADDVARQSGGWTISWQGTGLTNADFPGATTIWKGIDDAVAATGGSATLSPDGSYKTKPDVAIVVFGEKPYAEFQGDLTSLQLAPDLLDGPLATMRKLKAQGIPVVAVMVTGRPLFMNPVFNTADAFIAAWLPGSEGEGVADMLIAGPDGRPRYDFTGQLPAAWPATAKAHGPVLFARGYGLHLADHPTWKPLSEDPQVAAAPNANVWLDKGQPASSWSLVVTGDGGADSARITGTPASALDGRMTVSTVNSDVQEGARQFALSSGTAIVAMTTQSPVDLTRETNGELMLTFTMRVDKAPTVAPSVTMGCGAANCSASVPISTPLTTGRWVTYGVPLKCYAAHGVPMNGITMPFALRMEGPATISLSRIALGTTADSKIACPS